MQNLNGNFPRADHIATRVPSWSQFAALTLRHDPLATMRLMLKVPQRPPHGFDTEAEHTTAQEECANWAEKIRRQQGERA